jgi:S1-C subfamily serine protease
VITSLGSTTIANTSDLNNAMFPYHPGDKVSVGWVDPSGQQHTATLSLTVGPPT